MENHPHEIKSNQIKQMNPSYWFEGFWSNVEVTTMMPITIYIYKPQLVGIRFMNLSSPLETN